MTVHNEAYTTPSVGDNLLEDYAVRISNRWRRIDKLGYVGGSAIADGEIQVFVGSTLVGEVRNNDAGDVATADLILPFGGVFIPPGVQLSVMVTVAAAANYTLFLDIKDM